MESKEIVKALRRGLFSNKLLQMAADTIETLESEINRLNARIEALDMDCKQLHNDCVIERMNYDHIKNLWEEEKEKVANAKQKVIDACKMLKTAKAEAYKECIKKVNTIICENTYPDFDKDGKAVNIWNAKIGYDAISKLIELVGD